MFDQKLVYIIKKLAFGYIHDAKWTHQLTEEEFEYYKKCPKDQKEKILKKKFIPVGKFIKHLHEEIIDQKQRKIIKLEKLNNAFDKLPLKRARLTSFVFGYGPEFDVEHPVSSSSDSSLDNIDNPVCSNDSDSDESITDPNIDADLVTMKEPTVPDGLRLITEKDDDFGGPMPEEFFIEFIEETVHTNPQLAKRMGMSFLGGGVIEDRSKVDTILESVQSESQMLPLPPITEENSNHMAISAVLNIPEPNTFNVDGVSLGPSQLPSTSEELPAELIELFVHLDGESNTVAQPERQGPKREDIQIEGESNTVAHPKRQRLRKEDRPPKKFVAKRKRMRTTRYNIKMESLVRPCKFWLPPIYIDTDRKSFFPEKEITKIAKNLRNPRRETDPNFRSCNRPSNVITNPEEGAKEIPNQDIVFGATQDDPTEITVPPIRSSITTPGQNLDGLRYNSQFSSINFPESGERVLQPPVQTSTQETSRSLTKPLTIIPISGNNDVAHTERNTLDYLNMPMLPVQAFIDDPPSLGNIQRDEFQAEELPPLGTSAIFAGPAQSSDWSKGEVKIIKRGIFGQKIYYQCIDKIQKKPVEIFVKSFELMQMYWDVRKYCVDNNVEEMEYLEVYPEFRTAFDIHAMCTLEYYGLLKYRRVDVVRFFMGPVFKKRD